jgi:hypothetical protein
MEGDDDISPVGIEVFPDGPAGVAVVPFFNGIIASSSWCHQEL